MHPAFYIEATNMRINTAPKLGQVLGMQSIFGSPARLRSRFLFAYLYCRHAAEPKMLCIVGLAD
jgi:hypothetical protein